MQFFDQHLTASPYRIPDFSQGAAALESATAILDTETQARAMAKWHRSGFGVLQMSCQELGLAPNNLTCTEDLALPQSKLTCSRFGSLSLWFFMSYGDRGVGDFHHHGLAHADQTSLLSSASPIPSQAADMHQATSKNSTGISMALLEYGLDP